MDSIIQDIIVIDGSKPIIWVGTWFEITKSELDVIKGINNRIYENNKRVRQTMIYEKQQRYKDYLRLKEEFENDPL